MGVTQANKTCKSKVIVDLRALVVERVFSFIYFLINLFIYYFLLCSVFVAVHGLSLAVASRCYSVAVCGLLIVVASLVVEHGL